jgi:hypothetical protein
MQISDVHHGFESISKYISWFMLPLIKIKWPTSLPQKHPHTLIFLTCLAVPTMHAVDEHSASCLYRQAAVMEEKAVQRKEEMEQLSMQECTFTPRRDESCCNHQKPQEQQQYRNGLDGCLQATDTSREYLSL